MRKSNNYANFALVPNPAHFRRVIKLVFLRLGVDALKLQLYGVRRGAATYTFARSKSYDFVCEKGRWASHKLMRTYVNEAMKALTELKFGDKTNTLIDKKT